MKIPILEMWKKGIFFSLIVNIMHNHCHLCHIFSGVQKRGSKKKSAANWAWSYKAHQWLEKQVGQTEPLLCDMMWKRLIFLLLFMFLNSWSLSALHYIGKSPSTYMYEPFHCMFQYSMVDDSFFDILKFVHKLYRIIAI